MIMRRVLMRSDAIAAIRVQSIAKIETHSPQTLGRRAQFNASHFANIGIAAWAEEHFL
jgi:hypothetical protein